MSIASSVAGDRLDPDERRWLRIDRDSATCPKRGIELMARFTVKHNQAIWETTTFEVEVPDPLPEGYESPVDYIRDNSTTDGRCARGRHRHDRVGRHGRRYRFRHRDHRPGGNKVYADVDDGKAD